MVQITNVIDACCAFLERQLDPSNAIGIANFAEQHGCVELKQKANQFIERNFTQVRVVLKTAGISLERFEPGLDLNCICYKILQKPLPDCGET